MFATRRWILIAVCIVALLLIAPVAGALEWQQASPGIRYISGGVGFEERAELTARFNDAALRIVNVEDASGAYLAKVTVSIRGAGGAELLRAPGDGPWFMVDLPPGRYKVSSEIGGAVQSRDVEVHHGPMRDLIFRWVRTAPDPVPPLVPLHSAPAPVVHGGSGEQVPEQNPFDRDAGMPETGVPCPPGSEFEPGCL